MKIKLDENLPAQLASTLEALGHDVDTAQDEGLAGCLDLDLWNAAQKEERFLITQDLDFSDIRRFIPGTHHGILLVRLLSPADALWKRESSSYFETKLAALGRNALWWQQIEKSE